MSRRLNKTKGFFVSAADMETEGPTLFLDLCRYDSRHLACYNLPGDFRTQCIDNAEPSVATGEPPAHGSLINTLVPITENIRVSLAQQFIKLRPNFSLLDSAQWLSPRFALRHPSNLLKIRGDLHQAG